MADAQNKRVSQNLFIGSMGWSYAFWKGSFYPKNLAAKNFLSYYASQFNTVEVNSTFYRIPNEQTIIEWRNQTSKDFLFSLKFPQKITHLKLLKDCQEDTQLFLKRASLLEEKLGVLVLQFPPRFGIEHLSILRDYLRTLNSNYRYAIEIRNKSLLTDDFYRLLRTFQVSLVWVDSLKMPIIDELTSGFLYLRWEGDRKLVNGALAKTEINRLDEIQKWANRLRPLIEKKFLLFGYFSKYFSGYPPQDIATFKKHVHP